MMQQNYIRNEVTQVIK